MTVLWAVGDGATGGTDAAKVADVIVADKPDGFLWLGDVYESGTASEFTHNYAPSWGQLDSLCYPIPGNHDWPNYEVGYRIYFAQVHRPNVAYYYVDLGEWGLVMCNSEADLPAQLEWAEALPLKPGRKNIACWHRPRYCSGSHGDALDLAGLWELLGKRCALILSGHAHNMQQFKPDSTGCVQLVSGAGGRSLYAEVPQDPRLAWGKADGYGAVRLELSSAGVDTRWVDEAGIVLYNSTISV